MTFEYIKYVMENCECLNGFSVSVDYVSEKEKSISIIPKNSYKCLKTYSDGEKIMGFDFSLIIRLKTNLSDKSENYRMLDNIAEWIYSFAPDRYEINPGEKYKPLKIEVISGPILDSDDIRSGRYRIDCRFDCLWKNII